MVTLKRIASRCHWVIAILLLLAIPAACAPRSGDPVGGASAGAPSTAPRAEKRIVYASPYALDISPTGSLAARQSILPLIASGLSSADGQGGRVPILAERLPTIENGLWTLSADGTMVTTFKLRSVAQWHDGTPITADDFVFSLRVGREGRVGAFGTSATGVIADVRSADPGTLVVDWREPFNAVDTLFDWSQSYGSPLPRHLLVEQYEANPSAFLELNYWSQSYIGSGPFKVLSWEPGIGIQLAAHDGFALGRPRIDRIDVQFIPDSNTLMANLLTGSVDAAPNVGSNDTGMQLSGQWQEGAVLFNSGSGSITAMYPQSIDPTPAAIADLQFRTAMVMGIDRQAIAEQIALGLSPVPVSFLIPGQKQYAAVEAGIPRFPYDPQRAAQLLASRGYVRASDGTLREPTGQPLSVELRSAASGAAEQQARAAAVIAADWTQLGVEVSLLREQPARANDLEYVASFPGFYIRPRLGDVESLSSYSIAHTPVASNNYRAPSPQNWGRYANPELDGLITRYLRTIPLDERAEIMGQIAQMIMGQIAIVGLWHNTNPGARNNRVTGVGPQWPNASFPWNAYAWDLKG